MFTQFIGHLMGVENLKSINSIRVTLAAHWAETGPAWVLFGAVALAALALLFYFRYQPHGRSLISTLLAVSRAVLLILMFLILAEPVLKMEFTSRPRPLLWVLFDGTESMDIQDEMPETERTRLAEAVGLDKQPAAVASPGDKAPVESSAGSPSRPSRLDYVKALVAKKNDNLFAKLEKQFRLRAFILDRPDGVRELNLNQLPATTFDSQVVNDQLTAKGQVTAIGAAFDDLAQHHATSNLAGLLMISDFGNNNGPSPVGRATSPVKALGVPVYGVGVGPTSAISLATDLDMPLQLKKAERQEIKVILRQSGLDGRRAKVTVTAKRKTNDADATTDAEPIQVGQKEMELNGSTVVDHFEYVPRETGRFEFTVDVDRLEGQNVDQGNHANREVTVIDDFLRLMFVEYEPTWEWRFIKEVFHRDPLVGMRGFRTFLRSADPKVRQTNELFLPSLTPKRSDFMSNDVIFLGDMPGSALSERYCELTKEFVTQFGGGLVVIAGPRFGPGQLADTKLADILPVVVDPSARIREDHSFRFQLTPDSLTYKFMQLGEKDASGELSRQAWANMGLLPWYQPVKWKHPLATVLAEHPTDLSADGKAHQPLIAIREFPSGGKVVYIGFNETWRLRRKYGELYYRQFWGQMIQYLGLSNHIGLEKRFVVATDRQQYQPDDKVLLTVQAYDANFDPLTDDKLPDHHLTAELLLPSRTESTPSQTQTLSISQVTKGLFEVQFPVLTSGGYRVRVKDPITGTAREVTFRVLSLSLERRSAVRNEQLEDQIVAESGGRSYDLQTVARLPDEIDLRPIEEKTTKVFALWSTWLCFALVVTLMLGEWLTRKLVNLP